MPLKIYNSLTKQKEEFKPLELGKVKMYVCGPTVYDEPHIGHLRSAYVFEVMRNYFKVSGYEVKLVRNITDVDDKIIEKARQSGAADLIQQTVEVSKEYYEAYENDLKTLGIKPPTNEPKATEHITEMLKIIGELIQKGSAYTADGDVYFDVNSFKDYGKLSHQKKEAMIESLRINPNEKKKNPLDFALWKKVKEGEPAWDSPWGKGRPGWHIECSAMSMKYLGEMFDIHGGGIDLVFPHHENEIAQSESLTGKTFVKYWVHHGLITANEQKMSKSLKNFVTLKETIKKYGQIGIEEIKFLFLKTHYSAPLDYSEQEMAMVKSIRERFVNYFDDLNQAIASQDSIPCFSGPDVCNLENQFKTAMDDDFNTPLSMATLMEAMHTANKSNDLPRKLAIGNKIKELSRHLGLNFSLSISIDVKIIENQIQERLEARKNRDFKKADKIRKALLEKGIILKDFPDGQTTWRCV